MENNNCNINPGIRWALSGAVALAALRTRGWKQRLGFTVALQFAESAITHKCLVSTFFGPHACIHAAQRENARIDEASEESFPASDPPALAGQRA